MRFSFPLLCCALLTSAACHPGPVIDAGAEPFNTGGASHKATHYVVKIEIGGLAGLVAPLVGKQPPDSSVWVLGGDAPAFVKSEGPLHLGGPIWRIELVSPTWPHASATR